MARRRRDWAPKPPRLRRAMGRRSRAFPARFRREPILEDHKLYCWHSGTPRPMCDLCLAQYERLIVTIAEQAGLDPREALEIAGVEDRFGSLGSTH